MMEVEVKEGTAPLAVDEDLPDDNDIEMAEDALLHHTQSSGLDQGRTCVSLDKKPPEFVIYVITRGIPSVARGDNDPL